MSQYRIDVLKGPFPEGSKVGDVIEFDCVPAWALGKVSFIGESVAPAELQEATEVPDGVEVSTPRRGRPPKAE